MKNLNIEENNITREMALQNGQKLLEEKNKLRFVEKAISNKTSNHNETIADMQDSIFYKQLLAGLVFGSSMLLDAIFCANAIYNITLRNTTLFMLETSFIGFGISGILMAITLYDKRKINKTISSYTNDMEVLNKQKEEIMDNIESLEKVPHIANSMDLIKYDEMEILENIKRELISLREVNIKEENKVIKKEL